MNLKHPKYIFLHTVACFFFLVGLTSCVVNPVSGEREFVLVTEEQELELMGRQYHPQILKIYGGEYDDPQLHAYISRIGDTLAEVSHRKDLVYHFTVLDTSSVNAFAIPGYIYITRGMLPYLASEAELAGVLGHEMGHIAARHSVRQHTQGTLVNLLNSVISQQTKSQIANQVVQILSVAAIRGYGRKYELEADKLGAEYIAKTGYQPEAILNVLHVLKNQEEFEKQLAKEQNRSPNVYHGLFSTHPDSDKRLQEIIKGAAAYNKVEHMKLGRKEYLNHIQNLVFGSAEKEGVTRGARFYHRQLGITFSFPEQWTFNNLPTHTVIHNFANTAMIVITVENRKHRQTAANILRKRVGNTLLKDEKKLVSEFENWTGLVDSIKTAYGNKRARLGIIVAGKKIFSFLGVSKNKEQFADYDADFLSTIESFRQLKKDEYALAKPQRIKVIRIQEGDTFSTLAQAANLNSHSEEILRLINGQYPDGEVKAGEWFKMIH